jgi:hypothetical protein
MSPRGRTSGTITSQTTLRIAPAPRGAPQALDPYHTGANILTDPGFENFVDNSGGWYWNDRDGGASTYALPKLTVLCPSHLELPDGSCAPESFVAWAQLAGSYVVNDVNEDFAWKVSVNSPQAGDYHAIWVRWWNGVPPGDICAFSPFINAPHSARVNAGDGVTWSAYLKVFKTSGTPQAYPYIQFYNSGGSSIQLVKGTTSSLTTSYVQRSMSVTAPAGAHYMRCAFGFLQGTNNPHPVYLDSAVLGVTP